MNTTVYIIRHGEVKYPRDLEGKRLVYGPTAELSDEGRKQLGELGQKLSSERVRLAKIFTSPYPRAVESARILSSQLKGPEPIIVEDLKDLLAPGYEGTSYDDLISIEGNTYAHPLTDDQETLAQLSTRVVRAFTDIVSENDGKTIAIVSHGDGIRLLLQRLKLPNADLPDPATMRDELYLEKGGACKLVLDPSLRLLEMEKVSIERDSFNNSERKF